MNNVYNEKIMMIVESGFLDGIIKKEMRNGQLCSYIDIADLDDFNLTPEEEEILVDYLRQANYEVYSRHGEIYVNQKTESTADIYEGEDEYGYGNADEWVDLDLYRFDQPISITEALSRLSPREQRIMTLRMGLTGEYYSLEEVAKDLGRTVDYVKKTELKALKSMSKMLSKGLYASVLEELAIANKKISSRGRR